MVFGQLAQTLEWVNPDIATFVSGQNIFNQPQVFLIAYSIPLVIMSGIFLVLLVLLARQPNLNKDAPRTLFGWALAFACVSMFAAPVLYQDFWLSLAWGRMVASGINPYYVDLTQEVFQGIPLDNLSGRMNYGPMWALISGAVMWFARGDVLIGAAFFKILLAGAWGGSLWLIWTMLKSKSLSYQCAGILIFGWLPLSVIEAVADGHNDIFLLFFVLLWLYNLAGGKSIRATLLLTTSILVKYLTAPLFLLDFLHHGLARKRRLDYGLNLLAAGVSAVVILGIFYRSPEFFAPVLANTQWWHFFRPSDAVVAVGRLIPVPSIIITIAEKSALVFFPLLAVFFIFRYLRQSAPTIFLNAIVAIGLGILFSALGYLWPWYLLWSLGVMALTPSSVLTRWGIGLALALPFPVLAKELAPQAGPFFFHDLPGIALYTFAILWFFLAPQQWFPEFEDTESSQTRFEPV
jgi:hypothetical protein